MKYSDILVITMAMISTCACAALADSPSLVSDIAKDGMLEVKLGKLAEQKANNADVRAFAKQMVKDHSAANDKLKIAAKQDGVILPAELSPDQNKVASSLSSLSGTEFDSTYMKTMVAGHDKAIDAVSKEAETGSGHTKSWAESVLPTIKHHKEEALQLNNKLSGK